MENSDSGLDGASSPLVKKEHFSPSGDAASNGGMNGLTNGHSEKERSHKSEHRDKDKHRSDKHKDKHREKDRDKEKKHSSSSSSKDKHHSSSSKDKHRDKERSDKERSKDKHSPDKEKERSRDAEKHKDKDRSDRDKSKHDGKEKSKHEHKSSSSSKEHKSSSKDKERISKDKEREHKDKDRSKEKHSSSSEKKSKDHGSSKHSEKPKIKDEPEESAEIEIEKPRMASPPKQIKPEIESEDDDKPLMERASLNKRKAEIAGDDSEEDVPLMQRKKPKKEKVNKKRVKEESEEEDDFKPAKKAKKKSKVEEKKSESPTKRGKKKEEEEKTVWKWWEEEKPSDGTKWSYLEHKGPVFAPAYEPLPDSVKFHYGGKQIKLSEPAEEVAGFYAKMLEHEFTTKKTFNENFFKDWRKTMTSKEKELITDLKQCDFKQMHAYFQQKSEERKAMTKEEKQKIKEENEKIQEEYGFCVIDGHKEKIGNYKIEPPGLFRGRGEHPKMGKLKARILPEDVIINCSKGAPIPKAPAGHRWKEVRHDNSVTWLCSWTENVQGQGKYVMLNPSSKLKGEKDMQKYETARKLHRRIDKIREEYRQDWKHKEMRIRQRSVALYFIDRLALRAGNEKDEDQADTVGCCSLRVEHIELHEEKDGKPFVVVFDFLGKDSIRYYNEVPVEKRVFKNLQLFMENKNEGDDLFDRLNTSILNKHLNDLMDGLTAKVFRTYNASITLQRQLEELTVDGANLPEMMLSYNRANRAVAILCNHQRSVPKTHAKSMENLKAKIDAKKQAVEDAEQAFKDAKKEFKRSKSEKDKINVDKKKKAFERQQQQLGKLELQATDREENKEIALGTSKLNYLDPRISVAWCKKNDVPIEKVYNKTQREKFRWAIDMAGPEFIF
ncbi:DNA topoisomerase I, mitochondrial isoform X2 [Neocloeon triangulifer]|uniref:DNA topoisomerase I, mitochondrial isoform X2 n=1 Tax=Neocloeon triangulifer TaxID=2078957 RepID=UPI00286FAE43|nr:DNA topoisomerase I, mitochondrial isoform X2 [Neocloeon triangulifer]